MPCILGIDSLDLHWQAVTRLSSLSSSPGTLFRSLAERSLRPVQAGCPARSSRRQPTLNDPSSRRGTRTPWNGLGPKVPAPLGSMTARAKSTSLSASPPVQNPAGASDRMLRLSDKAAGILSQESDEAVTSASLRRAGQAPLEASSSTARTHICSWLGCVP